MNPANLVVEPGGGSGTITITTSPNCTWSAFTTKPWIALTGSTSGSGSGTISWNTLGNASPAPVTGAIQIGGLTAHYVVPIVQRGTDRRAVFEDVPASHPFFDFINMAGNLGLSRGCTSTTFCPDSPATRGQAAAMIVRAILGGDNFSYPPAPYFTDVPATHPQFPHIQKLRELGITGGCSASPARFCPEQLARRDETATLMTRSRGYRVPFSNGFTYSYIPYFNDVLPLGNPHFPFVQELRENGVTSGCSSNPPLYCPDRPVTRGQLATFLVRFLLTY
jgi:hypothetical protein